MIRVDKRNVAWSTIDDTLCLFSYTENRYIQLNRTAQLLFEGIIKNDYIVDMADLKNKMCMKYPDTDQLRIENDVNRFIEWLLDKKVLIRG
jgi:hypothetical protein